jgi:chemotaxis protein CheD
MQIPALSGVPVEAASAREERPSLFLQAGQLVVTAEPQRIVTIVGSCVSVCLWRRDRRHGGINHFLLAHPPSAALSSLLRPLSYGEQAMHELIRRVCALGSRPGDLQAKVFGGAETLGGRGPGKQNIAVALEILAQEKIPVAAVDVAGTRGRKLIFDTSDGSVLVRQL